MGYPEKEEWIEILQENFTPREAEVALAIPAKVIPFEPVPVSEILPHVKIPKKELECILSNLAHRGLLFSKKMKKGEMRYALQQFGYGFPQTFFWRGSEESGLVHLVDNARKGIKHTCNCCGCCCCSVGRSGGRGFQGMS